MENNIEAMKKMRDSLVRLGSAWLDVMDTWYDENVINVMEKTGYLYPFEDDFEAMSSKVAEWTFNSSNELRKAIEIENQWEKIENSTLNNIDDILEIMETLRLRFKEKYC